MYTKMVGRLMATALLGLTVGCQGGEDSTRSGASVGTREARVESQCLEQFEGIQSCALGRATLAPARTGVQVSGLEDARTDGVSSNFERALHWTQQFESQLGHLSLAARDGDQVVSTLEVTPGEGPEEFALLPRFTGSPEGSSYRVNVYRAGMLQGTTGGASRSYIIRSPIIRWTAYHEFLLSGDYIAGSTPPGACVWRLGLGEDASFRAMVDGREVVGDMVEFIEEVEEGAYPYTSFSGIDVKGSTGEYTILGESILQE